MLRNVTWYRHKVLTDLYRGEWRSLDTQPHLSSMMNQFCNPFAMVSYTANISLGLVHEFPIAMCVYSAFTVKRITEWVWPKLSDHCRATLKCQQDNQGCIPDHAFTLLHVRALCNARLVDEPQSSYLSSAEIIAFTLSHRRYNVHTVTCRRNYIMITKPLSTMLSLYDTFKRHRKPTKMIVNKRVNSTRNE